MRTPGSRISLALATLMALGGARSLRAQIGVGTWVRQGTASMPGMTLTVEACCGKGRRLTYHVKAGATSVVMVVESRFDGSDAPLLVAGKPSGQTMAIKRVDDRHMSAVLKVNGQVVGTSQGALSPDGRTLTVLDEFTSSAGGQATGKFTEIWVRQ